MNSIRFFALRVNHIYRSTNAVNLKQSVNLLKSQKNIVNFGNAPRFSSSHSNNNEFSRSGLIYTLFGSAIFGVLTAVTFSSGSPKKASRPVVRPVQVQVSTPTEPEEEQEAVVESTIDETIDLTISETLTINTEPEEKQEAIIASDIETALPVTENSTESLSNSTQIISETIDNSLEVIEVIIEELTTDLFNDRED